MGPSGGRGRRPFRGVWARDAVRVSCCRAPLSFGCRFQLQQVCPQLQLRAGQLQSRAGLLQLRGCLLTDAGFGGHVGVLAIGSSCSTMPELQLRSRTCPKTPCAMFCLVQSPATQQLCCCCPAAGGGGGRGLGEGS